MTTRHFERTGQDLDWFESITGFKEGNYQETKSKLIFEHNSLYSRANQKRFDLGQFELAQLQDLRHRVITSHATDPSNVQTNSPLIRGISADAYRLHCSPETNGAVVQVASQFNLLEMAAPSVSPEDGVTRYQHDHTQGPACALAAGPATLFRNYGIWVNSQQGQTSGQQVNTLHDIIAVLDIQGIEMRNGYAMIDTDGLYDLSKKMKGITEVRREELKGLLKVGVHWNTVVTATGAPDGQKVTQVFCSALPIAYNKNRAPDLWEPLARLVLEACYEATILVGVLNAQATGNPRVYLTRVGGGVFGNDGNWIDSAIEKALDKARGAPLDVILVSR